MVALRRVLWVGGSSGAGKSTAARLLARRHGLRCHSTDTMTWNHCDRAIAAGDQAALKWDSVTPAQRQDLSLDDQLSLDFDRWPWVLADVASLPEHPPVIVEGTIVTPYRVPADGVAVWLTAPTQVRASRTAARGWGAAGSAADIRKAQLLHEQLNHAATAINTANMSPAEVTVTVEAAAAQWLATQPGLTDSGRRQALRRELNMALVEQHRSGWNRRGWRPDTSGAVRDLECECADFTCTRFVPVKISTLPDPFEDTSPSIIATSHR